jgi:hypothetical protein
LKGGAIIDPARVSAVALLLMVATDMFRWKLGWLLLPRFPTSRAYSLAAPGLPNPAFSSFLASAAGLAAATGFSTAAVASSSSSLPSYPIYFMASSISF